MWRLSVQVIESNLTFVTVCILQGWCLGGPTWCFFKKLHSTLKLNTEFLEKLGESRHNFDSCLVNVEMRMSCYILGEGGPFWEVCYIKDTHTIDFTSCYWKWRWAYKPILLFLVRELKMGQVAFSLKYKWFFSWLFFLVYLESKFCAYGRTWILTSGKLLLAWGFLSLLGSPFSRLPHSLTLNQPSIYTLHVDFCHVFISHYFQK